MKTNQITIDPELLHRIEMMKNSKGKVDQHFCGRRSDIIWNKKG
jgi:hypothetical protein